MPHLRLETSLKNIDTAKYKDLFSTLHQFICENTNIGLHDCKSRVFVSDHAYIGDQTVVTDFLVLEIIIFSDRPYKFKEELGIFALQKLHKCFACEVNSLSVRPAVKITDMVKELYFK